MFGAWQQLTSTMPRRSAMRAVIADVDGVRRGFLRGIMMVEGSFELVGVAENAEECVAVVANEQPELIICNAAYANLVPQTDPPFPLVIPVACPPGGMPNPDRVVCGLEIPLREVQVSEALARASARILHQKTRGLSALIEAYMAQNGQPYGRLEHIEVEDEHGQPLTLSIGDVLWIKASGNYVQLYTAQGVFEKRDTISNLARQLEPSGFTRIHRSVVVNERAVLRRKGEDGVPSSVVLLDGTELMVGPNFRRNPIC